MINPCSYQGKEKWTTENMYKFITCSSKRFQHNLANFNATWEKKVEMSWYENVIQNPGNICYLKKNYVFGEQVIGLN